MLWFNALWKNSLTYAKCIGEIERGGTCSDEVWNHMIARIHFLRAEVPSLRSPTPRPQKCLILRLYRVLLPVYKLFWVAYVGCLWRARQPTGPPPSKSIFALFQTSSLHVLPNTFDKCWGIFLEWIEPKDRFQVQEFRIRKFPYLVLYVLHKTEHSHSRSFSFMTARNECTIKCKVDVLLIKTISLFWRSGVRHHRSFQIIFLTSLISTNWG